MKPEEFEKQYPTKDYEKLIYSFTAEELRGLAPYFSAVIQGQLMELHLNQFLHSICMPRIGAPDSPDVGLAYDFTGGKFTLYIPKNLCVECKKRKAVFEYNKKQYCEDCFNLVKTVNHGKKTSA